MSKSGEIEYLQKIGPVGRGHALGKPYSDDQCPRYLMDLGSIMALLPPPPCRLIDLGVGSGWTSAVYAKRGYHVTALDISPGMIELARSRAANDCIDVEYVVADYENIDQTQIFDCAVFYDSLHHAADPCTALASVYRALKQGGICITLEPGSRHRAAKNSQQAEHLFGVTERNMHPLVILRAARKAGFRDFRLFRRASDPIRIGPGILPLKATCQAIKNICKGLPLVSLFASNIVLMRKP